MEDSLETLAIAAVLSWDLLLEPFLKHLQVQWQHQAVLFLQRLALTSSFVLLEHAAFYPVAKITSKDAS